MMKDIHLRTAVIKNLTAIYRNDPPTLIVEEMSVREGRSRTDVAVVNGALDGFELKSDRDRLDRLARQSEIYGAVFDRMTLVVGPRHERQAARMIPIGWGLERTEPLAGGGVLSKPRSHIHRRLAEVSDLAGDRLRHRADWRCEPRN